MPVLPSNLYTLLIRLALPTVSMLLTGSPDLYVRPPEQLPILLDDLVQGKARDLIDFGIGGRWALMRLAPL